MQSMGVFGVASTVLLLLAVAGAGAQTVITSISPTVGSLAGGTRLVITGSGFSKDRFTGGNLVYVGSYLCSVLNHKTSDTLVSSTLQQQHTWQHLVLWLDSTADHSLSLADHMCDKCSSWAWQSQCNSCGRWGVPSNPLLLHLLYGVHPQ